MLALLTLFALAAFIFYWARRLVKGRPSPAAPVVAHAADAWVVREVAAIVGKRLSVGKEELGRTLGGNPDPELVSSIERVVARIEVVYERLVAAQIEARVEVAFEDGTKEKSARTVGWSDLPAEVRDELGRTGASRVHRTWTLPWQR